MTWVQRSDHVGFNVPKKLLDMLQGLIAMTNAHQKFWHIVCTSANSKVLCVVIHAKVMSSYNATFGISSLAWKRTSSCFMFFWTSPNRPLFMLLFRNFLAMILCLRLQ